MTNNNKFSNDYFDQIDFYKCTNKISVRSPYINSEQWVRKIKSLDFPYFAKINSK